MQNIYLSNFKRFKNGFKQNFLIFFTEIRRILAKCERHLFENWQEDVCCGRVRNHFRDRRGQHAEDQVDQPYGQASQVDQPVHKPVWQA